MKKLLLLLFIFTSFSISAQTTKGKGVVKGMVIDNLNEPLAYISVWLNKASDSSVVTAVASDDEGLFSFENVEEGSYFLTLQFIGFDKKITPLFSISKSSKIVDVGELIMAADEANELSQVVIESDKSLIQNSIDKKTFNVAENITAAGGTATEILENVPSVEVDSDGNVSLRGSDNVLILIDGKQSNFTSIDQIPASSIESVEVITNPSAKYDPDGMSGIINIVLKKNLEKGINAGVTVGIGYNQKYNIAGDVAYRDGKLNVYGNYSLNHYEGYRDYFQNQESLYDVDPTFLNSNRDGTDFKNAQMGKIGLDYAINKNNDIGFDAVLNVTDRERTGDIQYEEFGGSLVDTSNWNRKTVDPQDIITTEFNVYYDKRFNNPDNYMNVMLNHSFGDRDVYGDYDQFYYVGNTQTIDSNDFQNTSNIGENRTSQLAIDFVNKLPNNRKLEYGAKTILKRNANDYYSESYSHISNEFEEDVNLSNNFIYDENTVSVYGIYAQTFKKFAYQAGLRLEQAFTQSNQATTGEVFNYNYFSFFPSLHLSYTVKNENQIQLSYSRRVNRPRSSALNPFEVFTDPYNVRVGDPYLKPEYAESVELGYALYKEKLTLTSSIYSRFSSDKLSRFRYVDTNQVSYSSWTNIDQSFAYGFELVANYKFSKKLRANASFNLNQTILSDNSNKEVDLNNSGVNWTLKGSANYTPIKDLTLQVTGWYRGERVLSQGFAYPMASLDAAVKKTFNKGKGTIGFRVSDIFNTKSWHMVIEEQSFVQEAKYDWESRQYWLTVTYRIGKTGDFKKKRKSRPSGGSGGGGIEF